MTPIADQPPSPGIDTSGKQPYPSGLLADIVAIHFPKKIPIPIAEQGLLKIGNSAVALDTGDTFPGMATGATGLLINTKPFTILTPGIVVYGKPQHGRACFMACTDGATILRGHQDVGGDMEGVVWDPVYTVPNNNFSALSFAGGVFFVVQFGSGKMDSACAVSFDGENFSEIGNIYAGVPPISVHDSLTPGAVAFNGRGYATSGYFLTDPNYPNVIVEGDFNMAWASSPDASGWSVGYTPDEMTSPGSYPYGRGIAGFLTSIAGGAGRFIATATTRKSFQSTFPVPGTSGTQFTIYVVSTAAAALSSDGNSWTATNLPGAIEGLYEDDGNASFTNISNSASSSVVFVKTGVKTGYFVITARGSVDKPRQPTRFASWCWKGDGSSWQLVKQADDASLTVVSAIARDLSSTKILSV